MKKFNLNQASQIVKDICDQQVQSFGNLLYVPSGCVGDTDKVLDINLNYNTLTTNIVKTLVDTFGSTPSTLKFIQRNSTSIIRESGFTIGSCYIGNGSYTLSYGPMGNTTSTTYTF